MPAINKVPEETKNKFAALIADDGIELAAARLLCSSAQILCIIKGTRSPGLRLAIAIEDVYGLPVREWISVAISRII